MIGQDYEQLTLFQGGFPCQPFSVAGKRRGKEDDRYLWPEMLRVIQEIRPRWVVGENVAGIINMALDQVLLDLEGIGYTCEALVFPACAADAPHRRDRVCIVAHDNQVRCRVRGYKRERVQRGEQACHEVDTGRETLAHTNSGGLIHGGLKSSQQKPGSRHSLNLVDAVKMWPTPSASDSGRTAINPHMTKNGTIRHIGKNSGQSYARLDAVAAMYAAPTARSWKTPYDHPKRQGTEDIQTQLGGTLNPDWVEWMMGFPTGWTQV